MMVSGSIMDSKGNSRLYFQEFDNPAENNGIAEDCDYDRSHSFFTKLRYRDLSLEGIYNSRTKGVPTGFYDTIFNDPRDRTLDEHASLDLKYDHVFENSISVMARIYYDYYKYHGDYVYSAINEDIAKSDAVGGELLIAKQLFEKHNVLAGFEIHENIKLYQNTYNISPFEDIFTDNRRSHQWAFYIQDEFRIVDTLIFSGGIRYDHYSTFGGTINPRLALLFKPFAKSSIKLLYGEAFRAPNAFEFFYDPVLLGQKSNPELNPEKIRTYELIYEQYISTQFKASVSGYVNKIDNLITQTIDPADNLLVFVNSGPVNARGLEFELEAKRSDGLQGRLSYAFSKTKDEETGNTLSNSPSHLAKLNIIIPLINNKVFLGLEEQYTSKRRTLDGSDTKGFVVTNVTVLGRNIVKGLELSGSVYNLFGARYGDPGTDYLRSNVIQQDGRTFRVKLTYEF
jgi:outer membrane receptor for ferrienterochelin and colicins